MSRGQIPQQKACRRNYWTPWGTWSPRRCDLPLMFPSLSEPALNRHLCLIKLSNERRACIRAACSIGAARLNSWMNPSSIQSALHAAAREAASSRRRFTVSPARGPTPAKPLGHCLHALHKRHLALMPRRLPFPPSAVLHPFPLHDAAGCQNLLGTRCTGKVVAAGSSLATRFRSCRSWWLCSRGDVGGYVLGRSRWDWGCSGRGQSNRHNPGDLTSYIRTYITYYIITYITYL